MSIRPSCGRSPRRSTRPRRKKAAGAYQPRKADLEPADGQGEGWAAIGATRSAAGRWSEFLSRMASTLNDVSKGMTTAADSYTTTDANAARLIRKATW